MKRVAAGLGLLMVCAGCSADRLFSGRSSEAREGGLPAPLAFSQQQADGPALSRGALVEEGNIALSAIVAARTPADMVQLDVEVRPAAQPFTGEVTASSDAVPSDARAVVHLAGLASGTSFKWQARSRDAAGRVSPWRAYGAGGDADFRVAGPPPVPIDLQQYASDGTTRIEQGGTTRSRAVLAALVTAGDLEGTLRLEMEVRDVATRFSGTPTHLVQGVVSGTRASVATQAEWFVGYHWQARVCDSRRCSDWVRYGTNSESEADFEGSPWGPDR